MSDFRYPILFMLLIVVPTTACAQWKPDASRGRVFVSYPQVFTRERLIEDRFREVQWLTSQFKSYEAARQGLVDTRTLTELTFALKGGLNPFHSKGSESSNQPDNAKPSPNILPDDSKGKHAKVLEDSSIPFAKGQDKDFSPSLTAIERLTDEKTYRDAIAALLREKQLDDTHDSNGHTLYELKFDVSVFPDEDADQYAVIQMELAGPGNVADLPLTITRDTYEQFIHTLGREIGRESIALQRRVTNLSPTELLDIQHVITETADAIRRSQLEKKEKLLEELAEYCFRPLTQRQGLYSEDKRRYAIGCYVQQRYSRIFNDIASIGKPAPVEIGDQTFFVPPIGYLDPAGMLAWRQRMSTVRAEPEVISIEPKEYAQNITNVSANEHLINVALSLNAIASPGLNAEGYGKYVRGSQEMLHAIQRKPLVVSYGSAGSFGWLMGPKFTIQEKEVKFAYAPMKHSFTVSIKAPAWVNFICLKADYTWIDRRGRWGDHYDISGYESSVPLKILGLDYEPCPKKYIAVELLPDPKALVTKFLQASDRNSRQPRIDVPMNGKLRILNPSKTHPQTVLIRGSELWRNPKVYLGPIEAQNVTIAPDMAGLLATFVHPIPISNENTADLTVITTFGSDTLPGKVEIVSPIETSPSRSSRVPTEEKAPHSNH